MEEVDVKRPKSRMTEKNSEFVTLSNDYGIIPNLRP